MALLAERRLKEVLEILVACVGGGDDAELVATQPDCRDRAASTGPREFLGKTAKQRVPGAVAVRIVVALETVEICEPQNEALRRLEMLLDGLDQRTAVAQAGQIIGPCIAVVLLKRRARRRLPAPPVCAQQPQAQAQAEQASGNENDRHGAS